jgi:hypothetical protein
VIAESWARGQRVPLACFDVFYTVAMLAGDTKGVVADEDVLCAKADVSPSELVATLDELEEWGLLVWEQTMSGRTRIELDMPDMPSTLNVIKSDD